MALDSNASSEYAKLLRKTELGGESIAQDSATKHKRLIDKVLASMISGEDARAKLDAIALATARISLIPLEVRLIPKKPWLIWPLRA